MSLSVLKEKPLYGLFLQMGGPLDDPNPYAETLDLIEVAEALGYYSARVTQHHFGERYGRLPSPLPFLAAAGQRARQIRLGTVVVTVPLEHTLRLAEDAAVTDHLLEGRLELGLGSGLGAEVFATFGVDFERRREVTLTQVKRFISTIRGETLDEQGTCLYPPVPSLADRLWFAAMSPESTRFAAENNLGLLLGRVEHNGWSPVANQTRTTQIYRENFSLLAPLRIAAGRTIYPADDRKTAERDLAEALKPQISAYVKGGFVPADAPFSEVLARLHVIYGHPEEIAQTLAEEYAALGWTELLVQIDPGNLPYPKALRALERFANEVIPQFTTLTASTAQFVSKG